MCVCECERTTSSSIASRHAVKSETPNKEKFSGTETARLDSSDARFFPMSRTVSDR